METDPTPKEILPTRAEWELEDPQFEIANSSGKIAFTLGSFLRTLGTEGYEILRIDHVGVSDDTSMRGMCEKAVDFLNGNIVPFNVSTTSDGRFKCVHYRLPSEVEVGGGEFNLNHILQIISATEILTALRHQNVLFVTNVATKNPAVQKMTNLAIHGIVGIHRIRHASVSGYIDALASIDERILSAEAGDVRFIDEH